MSGPPLPHTKHPPSPSSPIGSLQPPSRFLKTSPPVSPSKVGSPPDTLIVLRIFLIIVIAAYTSHFFLWTYFPPDAIIPGEIDLNIVARIADRRRQPRVQEGMRLQWGVRGSASDRNNTTGEEEEERYEVDQLCKLLVEKGEEGAFCPRSNDCHTDNNDGDEHAKSARSIMLPKHFV